ncbi:MAG: precorrin-3B C(17)-methyltransferase [Thermodesulfovibrionales bacterium]|nr:precorrin-3B C(17)-methyltransferase [Thermodesulfovibrionales bacterium]
MSIAIIYITNAGLMLANKLRELYSDATIERFNLKTVCNLWSQHRRLIFIMAAGIVVRTITPLLKDKKTDPAVVVLDEKGKYAISLLSGHLGGANEIAKEIANFLGGEAVITTASDINNLPSIDLWAQKNNLVIEEWSLMPHISTKLLNNGFLTAYSDIDIELPNEFQRTVNPETADFLVTNKSQTTRSPFCFHLRTKNLVVGIGCNSRTSAEEIEEVVMRTLRKNNLSFLSIHSIATIDKKSNEAGLLAFAKKYGFRINTFTANELNTVEGIKKSEAVFKATGAYGVSEPAAILASDMGKLVVSKQKDGNVTIAIAERQSAVSSQPLERQKNSKLYIVGTGPGGIEHITPYAQKAIRESDIIVGYSTYLDLIRDLISDKEVVSTGMTQEIDRCKKAVELAMSGKIVSVISGGDPGVYAMAGLVFEIVRSRKSEVRSQKLKIEVVPGISALNACAARLGAPLMHDFASISLSDRLTPWELIEQRLKAAAEADFITILYNPKSKGRTEHIQNARAIFLKYRSAETPVGIVKAAMRDNESIIITNLRDMLNHDIDMQTTVIIGNSSTFVFDKWMITPRGYKNKYEYQ